MPVHSHYPLSVPRLLPRPAFTLCYCLVFSLPLVVSLNPPRSLAHSPILASSFRWCAGGTIRIGCLFAGVFFPLIGVPQGAWFSVPFFAKNVGMWMCIFTAPQVIGGMWDAPCRTLVSRLMLRAPAVCPCLRLHALTYVNVLLCACYMHSCVCVCVCGCICVCFCEILLSVLSFA